MHVPLSTFLFPCAQVRNHTACIVGKHPVHLQPIRIPLLQGIVSAAWPKEQPVLLPCISQVLQDEAGLVTESVRMHLLGRQQQHK